LRWKTTNVALTCRTTIRPEVEDDLLRRISLTSGVVGIETKYNRYELDVSRVDRKELEKARTILRRMNFDDRFTLELV
jgi:hypothetical protein